MSDSEARDGVEVMTAMEDKVYSRKIVEPTSISERKCCGKDGLNKERAAMSMYEQACGLMVEEDIVKFREYMERQQCAGPDERVLNIIQFVKGVDPCLPKRCVMRIQTPDVKQVIEMTRFCICNNSDSKATKRKPGVETNADASKRVKPNSPPDLSAWFQECASNKNFQWVRDVVERNTFNLQTKDIHGFTGLMYAAKNGHKEIVDLLLGHNAETEHKDALVGRSALMWAVIGGHQEVVRTLIRHNADLEACSKDGITPLLYCAQVGDAQMADIIIKNGANLDARDGAGFNALMYAASAGHTQIAINIAQEKVDLNCTDKRGCTPLMLATRSGHYETALALAEVGADITRTCDLGYSALHFAARAGHHTTVLALLSSVSAGDDCRKLLHQGCKFEGNTPLMLAGSFGRTESACILVRNGANIHEKNKQGLNAIDLARIEGHQATASTILRCSTTATV